MTPWQGLFPMGRKPKYHKFRRPTGGRKLGQCRRPAGMLEVRTTQEQLSEQLPDEQERPTIPLHFRHPWRSDGGRLQG